MKFIVRLLRELEIRIDADNVALAEAYVRDSLKRNPEPLKVLSILPEGYVEPPEPSRPTPPFGRPNGGGTPGTPVVKREILVDQIAEAA